MIADRRSQIAETGEGKVPARAALALAKRFVQFLNPHVERLVIAGSLRRRKPFVNDIEILFIPKFMREKDPGEFFHDIGGTISVNVTERAIAALLQAGVLAKRPNVNGVPAWGEKNKLGLHIETGIAVDLFTATAENWWNQLVCRTGSAATNVRICNAAIARGWKWEPYGSGFSRVNPPETRIVRSEHEVFYFVALSYLEPWER